MLYSALHRSVVVARATSMEPTDTMWCRPERATKNFEAGGQGVYTITLTASSEEPSGTMEVTDILPTGLTVASLESARGATLGMRSPAGDESSVPAQQCGGGDCEDLVPAFPRDEPGEDGEPDPVCGLVADAGDLAAQNRVLVS
ncbi:DUF11 domain-containing protein [Streptomyces sp. AcE210]|nr:DUF11 domain-containing protein [Streptomyces sp. AcE210]